MVSHTHHKDRQLHHLSANEHPQVLEAKYSLASQTLESTVPTDQSAATCQQIETLDSSDLAMRVFPTCTC
eukprot:CCRYP_006873-RC/>CCRYP_006873-RC protein AED:0.17 eAED:0.17 QI:4544/0.66/0.75/1/0.33/0.25/4/2330/69